ncbi:hypothetical protein ABLG96_02800 [Nakamurella sp. A5-74]|uniref:Uncharacterized protein n=1 Tax=Nakamurella sp. A5-74 TaxID=3158264 RepID=A0AAU8DQL2_9ACTN
MDASRARTVLTQAAATLVAMLTGQGVAGAAPSTGSSAPSSAADLTGDAVAPSPFQGVPSWLLIVVGIVVVAFAIRVVARRDEGNPGRGGGRDRGSSDRPRRPFRPD